MTWNRARIVGLSVMFVALHGCSQAMTDAFFAETVTDSRQFHQVTYDKIDAHDENMTGQHKAMSPEAAAAIDALRKEFEDKSAALQKQADDTHSSVGENAGELIKIGLKLARRFTDLPDGASIAGVLTDTVDTKTGKLKNVMLASFKEVNTGILEKAKIRSAELNSMNKELKARLMQLSEKMRSTFASATEETRAKLESFVNDRQQFDRSLRDELKLTPAEMEGLKGMTTNGILALIAAAGGAAGIGIAGGRGGKSRSHGDIEKLKDSMARLTADIERSKPPLV